MRQQRSISLSILGILTRIFALVALGLIITLSIKFLMPSSIGMTLSTATALSQTEVTPTSFQNWRESAEAAVMQTRFAQIAMTTVTPPHLLPSHYYPSAFCHWYF